uniref:Uncharacterized protein n=1 Tax=Octopus bimaculoides TaxID=37653 RepID=A0A0L8GQ37_OCTBM
MHAQCERCILAADIRESCCFSIRVVGRGVYLAAESQRHRDPNLMNILPWWRFFVNRLRFFGTKIQNVPSKLEIFCLILFLKDS